MADATRAASARILKRRARAAAERVVSPGQPTLSKLCGQDPGFCGEAGVKDLNHRAEIVPDTGGGASSER